MVETFTQWLWLLVWGLKPQRSDWGAYVALQSRWCPVSAGPVPSIPPTPCPCSELSSPGTGLGCPYPSCSDSHITQSFWLHGVLCLLVSWSPDPLSWNLASGSLFSPSPHMAWFSLPEVWTLPGASVSDCALSYIYYKIPNPLGAVMASFYFFLFFSFN